MSHPLIIRPAAEDDLAEARDWYDAQQDGLGIAAVLLGPQYGFPRSRVGLAWEPLLIQARSASKGIRDACTSRAEHY